MGTGGYGLVRVGSGGWAEGYTDLHMFYIGGGWGNITDLHMLL